MQFKMRWHALQQHEGMVINDGQSGLRSQQANPFRVESSQVLDMTCRETANNDIIAAVRQARAGNIGDGCWRR